MNKSKKDDKKVDEPKEEKSRAWPKADNQMTK